MSRYPAATPLSRSTIIWKRVLPVAALTRIAENPLTRNGYALILSTVATSVLGLLFWIAAARLYTPEQVGVNAALITAMVTLCNVAQLNLGNVLNRFLPERGMPRSQLILSSYLVAASTAFVAATTVFFALGSIVGPIAAIAGDPSNAIWFGLSAAVWTLFTLQDSALAGLRQAVWVPVENAVYSIAKILVLIALPGAGVFAFGIFAAWVLPLVPVVIGVSFLIFGRLLPRSPLPQYVEKIDSRRIAAFFGWDYLGTLAMMAALGVSPFIVISVAGATAGANYQLAWTISYSIYLVGRSMGISLMAEGAKDRARLPSLSADAFVFGVGPIVVASALVALAASYIMALFGDAYTEVGPQVLRILALSSIPWGIVTLYLAAARVRGDTRIVASVQVATLLLVLGLGSALLQTRGVTGMALGWLVAHTLVALVIVFDTVRRSGVSAAIDWLLQATSTAAGAAIALRRPRVWLDVGKQMDPSMTALVEQTGLEGWQHWRQLKALPSQSDGLTVYVGMPGKANRGEDYSAPEGAILLVKTATTPSGIASLARYCERLTRLYADPRISSLTFQLPNVVAQNRTAERLRIVELVVRGEDGRLCLRRDYARNDRLMAASRSITEIHHKTSVEAAIDHAWFRKWIERPAESVLQAPRMILTDRLRRQAIATFVEEQRSFWLARRTQLGWGHGDFSPGNIVFSPPDTQNGKTGVAGILDWDRAEPDSPSGLDVCHLALTTRMMLRGEELGQVVRELLVSKRWSADEENWLLQNDAFTDPQALRAIVGLAWLQHVNSNLEKSVRYRKGRFWAAQNIDAVLLTYLMSSRGVE